MADTEQRPLDADGNPKKRFEVKTRMRNGGVENAIFIDGEMLDWSIDLSSLEEARKMGKEYFFAAQRDIEKHFLESVQDFLGREVTTTDIQEATKTGWI
jgi:hypothetical protein